MKVAMVCFNGCGRRMFEGTGFCLTCYDRAYGQLRRHPAWKEIEDHPPHLKWMWTQNQDHLLGLLLAQWPTAKVAAKMRRGLHSVKARRRWLQQRGLLNLDGENETLSLRQATKETGYHYEQLLRAKHALRQSWHRSTQQPATGKKRNTHVQLTRPMLHALCEWLRVESR